MKKYFHLKGRKIFYSDEGNGSLVVLIHGYLETSAVWESFSGKLSTTNRVIAIDLPGHGQSDVFDKVHTMEFMAEAVERLISAFTTEKAVIIGHSMGGYVTLAMADQYPEKIKGFCIFHSHPFADTPEVTERRKNHISMVESGRKFILVSESVDLMYASDNLEKFKENLERSKSIAAGIRQEGITAALRGMAGRPSRLHIMENDRIPYLWVLGAKDNYIDHSAMSHKVKIPPRSELSLLLNSGHLGFIEEEEKVLELVRNFCNRI